MIDSNAWHVNEELKRRSSQAALSKGFFMPSRWQQPWPEALCFHVVRPIWTRYLRSTLREFLQFWQKRPLGLKDELIRIWWTKVKCKLQLDWLAEADNRNAVILVCCCFFSDILFFALPLLALLSQYAKVYSLEIPNLIQTFKQIVIQLEADANTGLDTCLP